MRCESFSPEVPDAALTTPGFVPPVDIYEDEHHITLKLLLFSTALVPPINVL